MTHSSKPSAGSATGSAHNVFISARLKLTGAYVLVVAVILIGFSGILYQSLGNNLTDASEDTFTDSETHRHFVQDTLESVRDEILLIDLVILLVAAGASYAFAGYTLRPVQRSVEAQRVFSENASHELRTPLAVMKSEIEVLLRNPNPAKDLVHSTLGSTVEEIDRMAKMAADLLSLARSESQAIEEWERVDITAIAKRMREKMQPLASRNGIALSFSADGSIPIEGDRNDLEHVLLNLLQNAIEHAPQGSIEIAVAKQEPASVLVTVSDTGSGIAAEDLRHVFERFYKGEGVSGSGLGLSIVKALIEKHGGSIRIESTEGKGTVAIITLPRAA